MAPIKKRKEDLTPAPIGEGTQKGIKFNEDKTVDVNVNGVNQRFTQEQYKEYNRAAKARSENISADTQIGTIQKTEQELRLTNDIKDKINRGQDLTPEEDNFIAQQQAKVSNVEPQQQIQQQGQVLQQDQPLTEQPLQETGQIQEEELTTIGKINEFGEKLGAGSLRKFNPISKKNIAAFSDWARVAVTGKKPLKVQQAEGAIGDAVNTVSIDVELVKSGYMSYDDALQDITRAEAALSRLESTQKGIGQENLRYWSDEGKEVEEMIVNKKRRIIQLKAELEIAKIQQEQSRQALNQKATREAFAKQ